MAENEDYTTPPQRAPGEGIRIVGAEEAASAIESGAAEGRGRGLFGRGGGRGGEPGPGGGAGGGPGGPGGPAGGAGGTPSLQFPDDEPAAPAPPSRANPLVAGGGAGPELQHWSDPPTGEVPRILGEDAPEETWGGFARAPRWRNEGEDWQGDDSFDDLADETRLGALDTSRTEHSDLYTFDDPEPVPAQPQRIQTRSVADSPVTPRSSGRDNTQAIIIGGALGAIFLIFAELGPKFLVVLVAAVILALTAEIFAVLRRAGYKPATLLGLVATVALVFGCYWKGERALPLVIVLTVVFTFVWYLAGVVHARPTVNIAATLLAFAWGGMLGSYAALLLRPVGVAGHNRDGVAFLLAAVLCTVVNDVIAYVAGQAFGVTPLAPNISPSKTWEGFGVAAIATMLTGAGVVGSIHPFSRGDGFIIGVVIAFAAPIGDLCQSMVKRDIGLKDMGAALPGHGGLTDRFDGLLFVLPTVYYLLQVLHVGLM